MQNELQENLDKIKAVFSIEDLLDIKANKSYIQDYYLKNKIPYTIFHSNQNFVHMGITRDGRYKSSDLLEHISFIDQFVATGNTKSVLELATGRGANSLWLAEKHPDKTFFGIDLSEGQLSFAKRVANKYKNFKVSLGDFHNLKQFEDGSFDVIFIIEALCHSSSPDDVFREVKRLLRPGGYFIVYDGYRSDRVLSSDELIAAKITELGMAVPEFQVYKNFVHTGESNDFLVVKIEDLSEFVLPTMLRFTRLARVFFRFPAIAKLVSSFLPKEFLYNAVSGLLMELLVKNKVFEYRVTVFKK